MARIDVSVAARAVVQQQTLPVGGFSPGNMFQTTHTRYTQEMAEYVAVAGPAVAAGKRMMLRLDHEETFDEALAQGFDVCHCLGATFGSGSIPGGSVSAYASLCAAMASRWKGVTGLNGARLRILEVGGNEPNGQFAASLEVQLIQSARPLIRTADDTLLVCNGGLGAFGDDASHSTPRTYATAMFAAGLGPGDIDIWQGHLYEDPLNHQTWNGWDQHFPNTPDTNVLTNLFATGTTIREMLNSHGMTAVPIMSGESGVPAQSSVDVNGKTVVQKGFESMAQRRARGEKIGPYLVFTMRPDWATLGTDSGYGCVNLSWARNAAWTAAQNGIAA